MSVQLLLGTLIIVVTVIFHIACLVHLVSLLKRVESYVHDLGEKTTTMCLLAFAVLVIIGIHTIEAWAWSAIYYLVGEFTDFKLALYFSVVTSTTLGYGDITLSERWQLLSTFEAMGGLILFGASTAFLLGLMRKLFEEIANADEDIK